MGGQYRVKQQAVVAAGSIPAPIRWIANTLVDPTPTDVEFARIAVLLWDLAEIGGHGKNRLCSQQGCHPHHHFANKGITVVSNRLG